MNAVILASSNDDNFMVIDLEDLQDIDLLGMCLIKYSNIYSLGDHP